MTNKVSRNPAVQRDFNAFSKGYDCAIENIAEELKKIHVVSPASELCAECGDLEYPCKTLQIVGVTE